MEPFDETDLKACGWFIGLIAFGFLSWYFGW